MKTIDACKRLTRRLLAGLIFLFVTACNHKIKLIVIEDVSKPLRIVDSVSFEPGCCTSFFVTGHLDSPAYFTVRYFNGVFIDSVYLPKGEINIENHHGQDLYQENRIIVQYYPLNAKKGKLRIQGLIF